MTALLFRHHVNLVVVVVAAVTAVSFSSVMVATAETRVAIDAKQQRLPCATSPTSTTSVGAHCANVWGILSHRSNDKDRVMPPRLVYLSTLLRGGAESEVIEEQIAKEEESKDIKGNNKKQNDSSSSLSSPLSNSDKTNTNKDREKYEFSVYQPGDGSHKDPDRIPDRFLSMHKGNREAAKASLEATIQWRQDHKVDTILERAHTNFDICKTITPHSFLGRDATGHFVFFQRPAVDSGEHLTLAKKNHMSNDDLVMHYVYVLEYCWNLLDPPILDENGDEVEPRTMTSILDLTGLDLSVLRHRDLIGFVKQFVQMMSTHYPQRSHKTLLLNAPSWFGMLYKLISPMLREGTRAKVEILSHGKHQVEVLRDILGDECLQYLPPELLETDKKKHHNKKHNDSDDQTGHKQLPISPMEQELRDFCCARLEEAGLNMKRIIR